MSQPSASDPPRQGASAPLSDDDKKDIVTLTLTKKEFEVLKTRLSNPPLPMSYRQSLEAIPGSGKEHFADALSTVDPKNLHARARIPAVFAFTTHSTIAKYLGRKKEFTNQQGVIFNMKTVGGVMDCWGFEYEAISIGLDGKGREEVRDVLKLAAIGGSDEGGAIASSVLNEGAKNLSGKSSKTS